MYIIVIKKIKLKVLSLREYVHIHTRARTDKNQHMLVTSEMKLAVTAGGIFLMCDLKVREKSVINVTERYWCVVGDVSNLCNWTLLDVIALDVVDDVSNKCE